MSTLPAEPSFKDKISASWMRDLLRYVRSLTPVAGPGMKVSRGPNGTVYSSKQVKPASGSAPDPLHPWKVFAVGKSEDVDHLFEIYVPDGSIVVGAKEVEVEGIEETETPKRFTFSCETDVGESSTLHLVVYRDKEEDNRTIEQSEQSNNSYKSVLAVNIEEYEDDESVRAIIPIAELAVVEGDEYDKGKVVSQIEKEAIRLEDFEVPTDKVSIDKVTKDDAADSDAIQVKDFDNDESDGGQGLAERLELEKIGSGESATYKIKAKSNDSKVHIVARVNGKLKYIPLSGKDEKDPDEENPPPDPSDCNHPGDKGNGGGVNPDDEGHGGGGVSPAGGGVRPSGDPHPGDDNCNCD